MFPNLALPGKDPGTASSSTHSVTEVVITMHMLSFKMLYAYLLAVRVTDKVNRSQTMLLEIPFKTEEQSLKSCFENSLNKCYNSKTLRTKPVKQIVNRQRLNNERYRDNICVSHRPAQAKQKYDANYGSF